MLLFVVGCGGPAEPACAAAVGQYLLKQEWRTGDCAMRRLEKVVTLTGDWTPPAGCTGTQAASADLCAITIDLMCPGIFILHMTGVLRATPDASALTGVEQFSDTDASGYIFCSSTYDISYTRL